MSNAIARLHELQPIENLIMIISFSTMQRQAKAQTSRTLKNISYIGKFAFRWITRQVAADNNARMTFAESLKEFKVGKRLIATITDVNRWYELYDDVGILRLA